MIRQPSWASAAHGVPALAGRVHPLVGDSIHRKIQCETAFYRLKPGLHAPCVSLAKLEAAQAEVPDGARRGPGSNSKWLGGFNFHSNSNPAISRHHITPLLAVKPRP